MDLDLKVWKELAIEKQMLMRTVTDALSLSPEASEAEIKEGITNGVKLIAEAQVTLNRLKSENKVAVADIQKRLDLVQSELTEARGIIETLKAEQGELEARLKVTREAGQAEALSLKTQLENRTRELKKINSILGDSPENAAKKIKALNKKKFDATEAQQRAERDLKNVKKEKRDLEQELEAEKAKVEKLEKDYEELQASNKGDGDADESVGLETKADAGTSDEQGDANTGKKAGKKPAKKKPGKAGKGAVEAA